MAKGIIHSHEKFDVDTLHKQAMKRIADRSGDDGPHAVYDVNVKASYDASLALINNDDTIDDEEKDLRIAHLESVLSAGECKYA
jgi:hypothetical protein